jgi:hypothetical protein
MVKENVLQRNNTAGRRLREYKDRRDHAFIQQQECIPASPKVGNRTTAQYLQIRKRHGLWKARHGVRSTLYDPFNGSMSQLGSSL